MFPRRAQLSIVLFALAAGATAPAGELIDGIAAIVDREVILRSELLAIIQPALSDIRDSAQSQEEFDRLAQELLRVTLDEQVENKLLLRQAEFVGHEVTDEQVDEVIANIRTDNDLTYDEFLRELDYLGMNMDEFRQRQRERITARGMAGAKRRDLTRDVVVSEDQIRAYYDAHRSEYEREAEIHVRQIQLQPGDDPGDRATARARLQMIRRELDAGADFGELARAHSQDIFADDGGSMGWIERGLLQEALEDAAFALQPGETTPILETPVGLHLIQVDERREEGQRTLDEVRGEIEPIIRSEAAEERYQIWMADLRKRSRVRISL